MKEFKPDFKRLKKVLLRDGEPDVVPFYELFADPEIMQACTRKPVSAETVVEFYYSMGYDYTPAEMNYGYKRLTRSTRDTAELFRGERSFVDDNHGIIENKKDFDSYPWPVIDKSILKPVADVMKYLPDGMKVIISYSGGIHEHIMLLMGYVPFSYAIYDDEQLISDMFERLGTNYYTAEKLCLENLDIEKIGAIEIGDDLGFNQGTLISPELLRKYVFPWHKKVTDLVHSYDIPVTMHSCGNLESIMDDLIDYVGIDAKHSFEDKILPVTEAKKKYGGRIAIMGGIDINFLCISNEKEVRDYVDMVIEICAPGGGYALGTGNSVANYIPLRNYLAMLDEGRKKGTYPIFSRA